MNIFIDGKDKMGWSIDSDKLHAQNTLRRLGIKETKFSFSADIIHNIWWNNLKIKFKNNIFKPRRKILVTTSNFIDFDLPNFNLSDRFSEVSKIADAWICPSSKQRNILDSLGLKTYYQPFYLDIDLFKPNTNLSKKEICTMLNIPYEKIEGKITIGSFQRDSLGSDLSKPKWQKDPDLLISLLKGLPKDKYILLLAGPRRHYVIQKCKENNIPYFYIGEESNEEDIKLNSINIKTMPLLYYLTGIYLVTSKSEGGPKAIMEATMTKTFILSTDVGLASDFLNINNVFNDEKEFSYRLSTLINENVNLKIDIEEQHKKSIGILNYDAMDKRLMNIYQDITKSRNE